MNLKTNTTKENKINRKKVFQKETINNTYIKF